MISSCRYTLKRPHGRSTPPLELAPQAALWEFKAQRLTSFNRFAGRSSVCLDTEAVAQGDLLAQVDNIKPDRTAEDLLFQVLVDWGIDLALPIATEHLFGKQVFFVDTNALAACFDASLTDDMVKEIAKRKPLRAVFRDASYGSDAVKINVEQIFKFFSPDTEVRSL